MRARVYSSKREGLTKKQITGDRSGNRQEFGRRDGERQDGQIQLRLRIPKKFCFQRSIESDSPPGGQGAQIRFRRTIKYEYKQLLYGDGDSAAFVKDSGIETPTASCAESNTHHGLSSAVAGSWRVASHAG
jgi:hypothetical protein